MAAALPQLRRDLAHSSPSQSLASHSAMVGFAGGWAGAAAAAYYGKELAALAQLEIEFSDGSCPDRRHR